MNDRHSAEGETVGLLPVNGAALAADTRVLAAVRAISTRHGFDYTDDTAVTALLAERRRALEAEQRRPAAWLGVLAVTAGLLLPFVVPMAPALTDHLFAALGAAGSLLVVGVALVVHARTCWKRALTHGPLAGYREVLGVARAHGIPLTHVPAWLEGRSSTGGGKGAAPIPTYETVEPLSDDALRDEALPGPAPSQGAAEPVTAQAAAPVAVPPKPEAVRSYETMADVGGWHDETGCLLILVGAGGAMWAATSAEPVGYGALLLVPLAVYVWLVGRRQGREKERLREAALAYVQEVAAAQAAGAKVPELSPELRKLTETPHA
ncbi:hypothetical protein [Streptomyces sp. ZSW22]|uniref:hypothetical protein n=1 Tax=Streptomyces sp. ZSW22 TaxID=3055050 RepID=UPI0025AFFAD1|nr:hypothetical protein [Streptomyces sp. ZSW22]MDN3246219.1 hypothetical protein [Streptomyces sp. ZSW22]